MSCALIPDFSHPLPTPSTTFRLRPADPILAAIDAHAEAWAVFQVAPEGRQTRAAETALHAALDALLTTPCGSRFGAVALVRHLRWYIAEEAVSADVDNLSGRLALVREADLSRFVGSDLLPEALPPAAPCGRLAPAPARLLPAHSRARRFLDTGCEALAAVLIIAGGVFAYGFLPFA